MRGPTREVQARLDREAEDNSNYYRTGLTAEQLAWICNKCKHPRSDHMIGVCPCGCRTYEPESQHASHRRQVKARHLADLLQRWDIRSVDATRMDESDWVALAEAATTRFGTKHDTPSSHTRSGIYDSADRRGSGATAGIGGSRTTLTEGTSGPVPGGLRAAHSTTTPGGSHFPDREIPPLDRVGSLEAFHGRKATR